MSRNDMFRLARELEAERAAIDRLLEHVGEFATRDELAHEAADGRCPHGCTEQEFCRRCDT